MRGGTPSLYRVRVSETARNAELPSLPPLQVHVEQIEITGTGDNVLPPGLYAALAIQGTTTRFPSRIITDKTSSSLDLNATLHVNAADCICVELWSTSPSLGGMDVLFGKCCFPISSLPTDDSLDYMKTGVALKSGDDVTATVFGIGGGIVVKSQIPANLAATVVVRFAGSKTASTTTPTRESRDSAKDAAAPAEPLRVRAPAIVSPGGATYAVESGEIPQQPRSS